MRLDTRAKEGRKQEDACVLMRLQDNPCRGDYSQGEHPEAGKRRRGC